jgi:isoleucyl-tRNA synthetase
MPEQHDKFSKVTAKPDFYQMQTDVISFWKDNNIFEKSVKQKPEDDPYTFYDGPPFVTGYPHYGHLIGSIAKDIIPRYYTMKGKRVRRVWGWDCHGLPIENKVEEKLGLKNRREIEDFGINKFIDECRKYVENISKEWDWYIDNIGRWVDMENAYRTMDLPYMESVIWVFKQLYDKDLVYKGVRTSLYCTRCGTPISNFEIAMDDSYRIMEDPAVYVKFKIKNPPEEMIGDEVYLVAWTTTPWTLPSNRALVVKENAVYLVLEISGLEGKYVVAEKRAEDVLKGFDYEVINKVKGKVFVGREYTAPYNYFDPNENDFKVYQYEDMVNMEEGTGIVHSAPGFGEIDTEMGKELDLTIMLSVDDEGRFIDDVKDYAGIYVKKADKQIIKDLEENNLLLKHERIHHRYPYCYRCETPLIQRAQESWFIDVQKIKDQLLESNEEINWVPEHFKHGRFKQGIEQAPDWCISRTRYWATVMPIWKCDGCGEIKVVGSVDKLEELSGQEVDNLHRSGVDHISFPCENCSGEMLRISEVLDCWIESGSMPYGERHYPFENKEEFERAFPADYITEYTGQVRAWFYVMHVLSNALMDSHCFKNVVVSGVMTGTDGRKMSKSYGNYPDPQKTIKRYGGDALRLYFLSSPIMLGQKAKMTKGEEIEEQVRRVLLILWNSYRYFLTYLKRHEFDPDEIRDFSSVQLTSSNILDQWLVSLLNRFVKDFEDSLREYRIPDAVRLIQPFINKLSTWYIRRSRDRFVSGDVIAFKVLYYVLWKFIHTVAPVIPFTTEKIYQNIAPEGAPESIHLSNFPLVKQNLIDKQLLKEMQLAQEIVKEGHAERQRNQIKLRQPLAELTVETPKVDRLSEEIEKLLKRELNVKELRLKKAEELKIEYDTTLTPELKKEGAARDLIRNIQRARKNAGLKLDDKVIVEAPSWPEGYKDKIKEDTLAVKLKKGTELKVEKVE